MSTASSADRGVRAALVTGGNRGLGLALVRGLARRLPAGAVYLGARDPARGAAAAAALAAEGLAVRSIELDLNDPATIVAARDRLVAQHGTLDLLVHSAAHAIAPGPSTAAAAGLMIETNNAGTERLLAAFAGALAPAARVVVVASGFGMLSSLPSALHHLFEAPQTMADITAALRGYVSAIADGKAAGAGWPAWANIPSKVGQVAAMRAFARSLAEARPDVRVVAACPGWTRTDASAPYLDANPAIRALEPDEAAGHLVWLALDDHPYHGQLVQYRRELPWRA